MNPIQQLAKMDWKGSVPSLEGDFSHNSLANLQTILERIKDNSDNDSKMVLRKCVDFTKNLKDAKDYYLAAKIYSKSYQVKQETVEFKNGKEKIYEFQIRALEKDFPGKNIRKIVKNISKEDFQTMLDYLYSPAKDKYPSKESKIIIDFLKENDLHNTTRVQKAFGVKPSTSAEFDSLNREDILYFLSGEVDIEEYEIIDYLKAASQLVERLDPKNREDFKMAVRINQAINQIKVPDQSFEKTKINELKLAASEKLKEGSLSAEKFSIFNKIASFVASLLGKSIDSWLSLDAEFVNSALSDATDLTIEVPENPSEKFWAFLETHNQSIKSITLTQEQYETNKERIPFGVGVEIK